MKIVDAHAHIVEPRVDYPHGYTVEDLLRDMDSVGIERAVLLQNPTFGTMNGLVRDAIQAYPGRFMGVIQVDPMDGEACARIARYASPLQNTLKLELSEDWGWSGKYPDISLLDDALLAIFDTVAGLGLRVIIDPGSVGGKGYQVENIAQIARRYPRTRFLIEHLGYLTPPQRTAEGEALWRNMIALGRDHDNIFFGLSAAGSLLEEPYPCEGSQELIRRALATVGEDKLLWGSDIPTTFKRYGYGQMIEVVTRGCAFLTQRQKEKIMAANAEKFFGWA